MAAITGIKGRYNRINIILYTYTENTVGMYKKKALRLNRR